MIALTSPTVGQVTIWGAIGQFASVVLWLVEPVPKELSAGVPAEPPLGLTSLSGFNLGC